MRILVTGSRGRIGLACVAAWRDRYELSYLRRNGWFTDKAVDPVEILKEQDVVVHLAGETDLDYCERKPKKAYKDNVTLTYKLARACAQAEVPIIYLSSDAAIGEPPTLNPISEYGWQKRASEAIIRSFGAHLILRVGWVYGEDWGYPAAIAYNLSKYHILMAPKDEYGAPVWVDKVVDYIERAFQGEIDEGVEYLACTPVISRWDLAKHIAIGLGEDPGRINPGLDPKYVAKRPKRGCTGDNLGRWQPDLMRWIEKRKPPVAPGAEAAGQAGEVPGQPGVARSDN